MQAVDSIEEVKLGVVYSRLLGLGVCSDETEQPNLRHDDMFNRLIWS